MDRVLINPAIVQDIADAIREKGQTTEQIVVSGLGDAVRALPAGVGVNVKEVVKAISGVESEDDVVLANAIASGSTDTPQLATFSSRETAGGAAIKNGVAYVKSIRGNSQKIVQLVDTSSLLPYSGGGITFTPNADGTIRVQGTATSDAYYVLHADMERDKKYFVKGCPVGGSQGTYRINAYNIGETGQGGVFTSLYSGRDYPRIQVFAGTTLDVVFRPQLFDLTAMGMEDVTTADEFAQRMGYANAASLPSFPYDAGSIRNYTSDNLKSEGVNLWDEQWELGDLNGKGQPEPSNSLIRSKNFCRIPSPSNKLYCKFGSVTGNNGVIFLYDSDKNIISYGGATNREITIPKGTAYFKILQVGTTYNHDICINISNPSINGQYFPYREPSTLDTSFQDIEVGGVQIFPNGGCSAGTAYDELTESKATKRVGVKVFDGTENWLKDGLYIYISNVPVMLAYINPIALCNFYPVKNGNAQENMTMKPSGVGYWEFRDDTYTASVDSWKAHLAELYAAGNPLMVYYELATIEDYTIPSRKMFYEVDGHGTESIDANSSPIVAEIGYRGE